VASRLWRKASQEYRGFPLRAAPGLHDAAFEILIRHISKDCGQLLDLAAGSGAWLARLRDAGYTDLTALEIDRDRYELTDVELLSIDLNTAFADELDRSFPVVSAIEIIEHLDCPRYFLRQIHRILPDGGHLLVSTPNLGHWAGRIRFLLSAEHRYFKVSDYHHQRHISPITHDHIQLMFQEIGFELIDTTTAGSFFGPIKSLLVSPFSLAFRLCFGARTAGDASVYLVKKVSPDSDSTGRNSYYFKA